MSEPSRTYIVPYYAHHWHNVSGSNISDRHMRQVSVVGLSHDHRLVVVLGTLQHRPQHIWCERATIQRWSAGRQWVDVQGVMPEALTLSLMYPRVLNVALIGMATTWVALSVMLLVVWLQALLR